MDRPKNGHARAVFSLLRAFPTADLLARAPAGPRAARLAHVTRPSPAIKCRLANTDELRRP
jgi:hypothetical protein